MKRLLKRNGFTTVELIVVVAVMAILLAIVVPLLSIGNARETEAKEYARSFYSNVQELMIDEKLAKNALPGDYTLVYVYVDENYTNYEDIKVCLSAASSPSAFGTPEELVDQSAEVDADGLDVKFDPQTPYDGLGEFVTSLRKMLLANDRSGYFYAVVDNKYRVVSAYFSYADFDTVSGQTFNADARLNDQLTGSWPEELCEKGKAMFELP